MGFIPTNFTMITGKTTILCKNVALSLGHKIFIDLQKFNCNSLLSNFPVKAKRYEIIFRDLLKSVEKTDC